jgi:tRNA dimethylallyltransferase
MSTHAEAPTRPLIAIVGATGTGKSDLAVAIASKFNGEIINGDAMQLYDGLPIITNKMPLPERKGLPHHLLGCIGLNEPTWTVGKFVESAVNVIDDIRSRGKLPILVGGTHYYTQALLFKDGLVETVEEEESQRPEVDLSILEEPTYVILTKLRKVDPVMADRWHPNDRRKIQRSLEIYLKSGKTASEIYEGQSGRGLLSLRYETLIFWIHAAKDVLFTRLDARVLKMIQNGLLDEVGMLEDIRQEKQNNGETVDMTRGIWVAIGYKEFRQYQQALNSTKGVSESDIVKLRSDTTEQTQAATRQYSNRQIRWIRIKLLSALSSANALDHTFILDGTDLTNWSHNVLKPASDIVDRFLAAEQLPDPKSISVPAMEYLAPKQDDISKDRSLWVRQTCDLCGVTSVTAMDWEKHIKSHGHRKAVSATIKRQRAVEKAG